MVGCSSMAWTSKQPISSSSSSSLLLLHLPIHQILPPFLADSLISLTRRAFASFTAVKLKNLRVELQQNQIPQSSSPSTGGKIVLSFSYVIFLCKELLIAQGFLHGISVNFCVFSTILCVIFVIKLLILEAFISFLLQRFRWSVSVSHFSIKSGFLILQVPFVKKTRFFPMCSNNSCPVKSMFQFLDLGQEFYFLV